MARSWVLTAVLFAVVLGACNSLQPKLDALTIQRAIEEDARTQYSDVHALVGKARCPANRGQKQGDEFKCHVTIDGQDAVYVVRQTDGHGTVRPTLTSHYLLFSTLNDQTLADLRGQGLDDVTVACGFARVWFVVPPAKRDCIVTLPDHTQRTAHVSIAADGGVDSATIPGLNP
jgi:hypothetical protein